MHAPQDIIQKLNINLLNLFGLNINNKDYLIKRIKIKKICPNKQISKFNKDSEKLN